MTIVEKIEVLRAFRDGKQVQKLDLGFEHSTVWIGCYPNEPFNFSRFAYRVTPIAREWWAVVDAGGRLFCAVDSKQDAESMTFSNGKVIKVREVLSDEVSE